ncbi:MAG: hypothetical protein ICV84_05155 [Flavisolibacter sp.]|nr:hypothetical protein [Flavisolibacter sp.]
MKLIRFGNQESEKPGVFLNGKRKDLSQHFSDWNRLFFREEGLEKLKAVLWDNTDLPDVADDIRWGPALPARAKFFALI